jgi:hypothetical protein
MRLLAIALTMFCLAPAARLSAAPSLVGSWHCQNDAFEAVADFLPDGRFRQATTGPQGKQMDAGRFQLNGRQLLLVSEDGRPLMQATCRFIDAQTVRVTYANGQTLTWTRVAPRPPSAPPPAVSAPAGAAPAAPRSAGPPDGAASTPPALLMQRVWEPNEKAFSFLLPKGWAVEGGVFNVNPLQMNGAGNTISPKCDLTVKQDGRGTSMLRWAPSWNYADLSRSPSGWGNFRTGSYYQGMPVRPMPPPRQFLNEWLASTRPAAADVTLVAEDLMPEVAAAYARKAELMNPELQRLGVAPTRFECLAIVVEYREAGERFREVLMTTIADARGSAFMWSNDDTITFRAPAARFEALKPIFDAVRSSRRMNPQWEAAVDKASGARAAAALETQRYIADVAGQIVENRRKTHADIRHENWLFISGREEYTNPFNGQTERDTSHYRYRWVNNQGDIIYSDENGFDPNRVEEYNTREWKRSPVRPR